MYRRQVDAANGEKLAKENKAAFVETSAKENINVGLWDSFLDLDFGWWTYTGKVFELCLEEIEKRAAPNQAESVTKSCIIM